MLRNIKLGTRFNLLLLLVFICSVSLSGLALSRMLQQKAQDEVTSKALTLMQTMTAVRTYTNNPGMFDYHYQHVTRYCGIWDGHFDIVDDSPPNHRHTAIVVVTP